MMHSVQAFCERLAATPLSNMIQNVPWIIPTVQTVHILSIAIVMSSVSMMDLRMLGVIARTQPLAAVAQRFLPWMWWTLLALLLSGSVLIVGEPMRSLQNPVFILKMSVLFTVVVLTLLFQRALRRDAQFWEKSRGRRIGGRLIAAVSLALWIGVVFAGRWIAYVEVDSA
jgi:uncharacterized membrane protein SirB2